MGPGLVARRQRRHNLHPPAGVAKLGVGLANYLAVADAEAHLRGKRGADVGSGGSEVLRPGEAGGDLGGGGVRVRHHENKVTPY